ncbi:MAG: hypothetical protein ABI832_20660 [bacterium]
MAHIKIETSLGAYGKISDFVGSTLHVVGATDTMLTLMDNKGAGFTFLGAGLTYNGSGVTGGTFTGLQIFDLHQTPLETLDHFSENAQVLSATYLNAGLEAAILGLLSKNDVVTGSSLGDLLTGAGGKDTIKGGGGADFIGGSTGNDKLFGQGGADVFLFVKGDGKDHIMDFTDTGAMSDDRIGLTHKLYNNMTVEETATGVTLHFGAKDAIAVDNWHVADVDISDFYFA